MDRQTLRDWVHRYNAAGIAGLTSRCSSGRPPALDEAQMDELKALVIKGPDPETDKVVRWRCLDLRGQVALRFTVTVHERTIGKWLRRLKLTRLEPRPFHPKKNAEAQETFKAKPGGPAEVLPSLQRRRPRCRRRSRRLQAANPFAVEVAEPGVAEPVLRACPVAVFFPEQRQRYIRPPQFAVHHRPIRRRPLFRRHRGRRRKQKGLKLGCRRSHQATANPAPPGVLAPCSRGPLPGSAAGSVPLPAAAAPGPTAAAAPHVSSASTISRLASRGQSTAICRFAAPYLGSYGKC